MQEDALKYKKHATELNMNSCTKKKNWYQTHVYFRSVISKRVLTNMDCRTRFSLFAENT